MRIGYHRGQPAVFDERGCPHTAREITRAIMRLNYQAAPYRHKRRGTPEAQAAESYEEQISVRRGWLRTLEDMRL
jgi:hypothetical protein